MDSVGENPASGKEKKKIVVLGGTGSIGIPLCLELVKQKYSVIVFTRDVEAAAKTKLGTVSPNSIQFLKWSPREIPKRITPLFFSRDILPELPTPESSEVPLVEALNNSLCVINLTGRPLFGNRCTKTELQHTRTIKIQIMHYLIHLLSMCQTKPKLFLNASSIGYYGKIGKEGIENEVNEESKHGCDFWGHGTEILEAESRTVTSKFGIPTINMRIGVVLDKESGILKTQVSEFKRGNGAVLATGKQWIPWIHLDDVTGIFVFAVKLAENLQEEDLNHIGAINVTSPSPIQQEEFAKMLSEEIKTPLKRWHTPLWLLRLTMGKPAGLLTKTRKVVPSKVLSMGFKFKFLSLQAALKKELSPSHNL